MASKSKRKAYTSKGGPPSMKRETIKAMRRDKSEVEKLMNKVDVWARGKRVMVTIPNPNKNETNKRFIRVEGIHSGAFGPWKREDKRQSND